MATQKENPGQSQIATVVARGNKKVFTVATTSDETNDQLLTRVNAVRVIQRINTNPAPSEWDDEEFSDEELNEASRQGWLGAQAMRREHTKRAQGPKYFDVTWYSPLRKKRTGFMRPIEAHTAADAKRQAKAMVENDPKASNFIAKEVKRNPKRASDAELFTMQLGAQRAQTAAEAAKQKYGYGSAKHRAAELAYKKASQRYQRAKARVTKKRNGIAEAAAGLQALEYIGGKVKAGGKPRYKINPRRSEKPFAVPVKMLANSGQWESALKPVMAINVEEARGFVREDFLVAGGGGSATAGETASGIKWRIGKPRVISALVFNRLKRRWNPRGSRDALGVWHPALKENPFSLLLVPPIGDGYVDQDFASRKEANDYVKARHAWAREGKDFFVKHFHERGSQGAVAKRYERRYKVPYGDSKVRAARRKKLNPSVQDVSKMFQGETNGAVDEMRAANSAPADLARIGRFVFLQVEGQRRPLRLPGAMVAADTKGRLWIVGNRTPLLSPKAKPGLLHDFGEVTRICYDTAKAHIGEGRRFEYVHEFGEDGGKRPRLLVDSEGMPILRGGDYKIEARGIVD